MKKMFLALTLLFSTSLIYADVIKIVESCNECHGENGVSKDTNVPSIGGFSGKYFAKAMNAYSAKERPCPEMAIPKGAKKGTKSDMCKAVAELSKDQIKELANHYVGQKFSKTTSKFDAALAAKGKDIHKKSCDKCHTEYGTVVADDAGILAGQQMGYIKAQLKDLHAGTRLGKTKPDKKMKEKFADLDEAALEALAHFYTSHQW